MINKAEILKYQPQSWPSTSENYFMSDDVPYLGQVVKLLKEKGITKEKILKAWSLMLEKKSSKTSVRKEDNVHLCEALLAFFEPVDYHCIKKHYAALLGTLS